MVDAWLIITTIIVSVVVLVCCFYLFVVYCHPEDSGGAKLFYKIIVISGMFICFAVILCMPLDVANSRGSGGGLNIDGTAKAVYLLIFVYVIFLLPFSMFLYETDEEKPLVKSD